MGFPLARTKNDVLRIHRTPHVGFPHAIINMCSIQVSRMIPFGACAEFPHIFDLVIEDNAEIAGQYITAGMRFLVFDTFWIDEDEHVEELRILGITYT